MDETQNKTPFEATVESDQNQGTNTTMDLFLEKLKDRMQLEDAPYMITARNNNRAEDNVKFQLGIDEEGHAQYTMSYEHFQREDNSEKKHIVIRRYSSDGKETDSLQILHNKSEFGRSSTAINTNGLPSKPSDAAQMLESVLNDTNDYNWRLVRGIDNVPEGEV